MTRATVGTSETSASRILGALSDPWFRARDHVLSSPSFQRWAAAFPLTRFIARRRASALFDLCAGFVYSQVLYASAELGLLEALARGPKTASELAVELSLPVTATERLLDAAKALRLVNRRSRGRYGLGIHGASFIGNPAIARMVAHHALFYRDLLDPVALLRGERGGTELARFWSYDGRDDRAAAGYSALMASSLSLIAEDILEAYPLERHRCLLDVAGGEGAFLEAAARRAPRLSLMLFDLPPVALRARRRLEAAGLASRARVVAGDVFEDPLPIGADVASLVRVVHDHDDPEAIRILRAVRRALRPGGVLLLAEPMSGTAGSEPVGDAYFGLYLLAMGRGRPRTERELASLLREAGFVRVRGQRTRRPMLSRLLVSEVG